MIRKIYYALIWWEEVPECGLVTAAMTMAEGPWLDERYARSRARSARVQPHHCDGQHPQKGTVLAVAVTDLGTV